MTQTDLSSLNQFIDDMDCMVTVVELAHHLGNTLWTDAVIWSTNKRGCKCARSVDIWVTHTNYKLKSFWIPH